MAHDISLDSWISGFLAFWISEFLVHWFCWFCPALVVLLSSRSVFAKSDLFSSIGFDITVSVAVFRLKTMQFQPKTLALLTIHPPGLNKSDCNLFTMSMPTRFCSISLDHTESLSVIYNIAPMQAKLDAQSCELCPQKTCSNNKFEFFSRTLLTKNFDIQSFLIDWNQSFQIENWSFMSLSYLKLKAETLRFNSEN